MSAYIHGSLALDDRQSIAPAERKQRGIAQTVVRAKAIPLGEKLLYLFAVMLACAVLTLIAYRYAATFELNSQLVKMESEIRQLEEENAALKNEVAKLQEPGRLMDEATKYGLVPRDELPAVAANGGATAFGAAQ
ncbi:cell division protein FtsL [Paenibacillus sp. TRM 82003]|nr:cell division protein FtsL [Paenibacillus sp. TRM 82003]